MKVASIAFLLFAMQLQGFSATVQDTVTDTVLLSRTRPIVPESSFPEKPQSAWLVNPVPDNWAADSIPVLSSPNDDNWWKCFDDPILMILLRMAEENNYELHSALSRIESASQALRKIRAAYYPNVGISVGWTKDRVSGLQMSRNGSATGMDYFSLGITANWEVDIFGKIKKQVEAGKYNIDASRAERAAVNLSVCSSVAMAYYTLRCYQEQLEVALDHIDSQEKILNMTMARYDAGLASALDVAQARTIVLSTKATVPQLHAMIESELNAIALLCGVYQSELPPGIRVHSMLPEPCVAINTGIPADLLRRRPDIVESEFQLKALSAKVGIAKNEFLPDLTISGSFGTAAHNVADFFKDESLNWSITPQLSWTIFDGFGRNADVAIAKADLRAAVYTYNQTVMQAVFEVNDNINLYSAALSEISLDRMVVEQSAKTLDLAVERYKLGLSDFTNVANAQLSLLENRNSLITAKANAINDIITLYRSLGGGWNISDTVFNEK